MWIIQRVKHDQGGWPLFLSKDGASYTRLKSEAMTFDNELRAKGACGEGERVRPYELMGGAHAR